ncbi:unnamed protein product [Cylindrotheca closterium]|uniref:Uncharacterized protein n=1 Tax=Cylindrotheca closterium TaxID=2856 RepID=A0AAD2CAI2_9STRA|nr:unnamed protein product [Cylindrotheca closterium]
MTSTVVSFFSPSPSASRRAQDLLSKLCKLEKVNLKSFEHDKDKLNTTFQSVLPIFSNSWDSVALKCQSSGTMVHFLSSSDTKDNAARGSAFSLLGITNSTTDESNQAAVQSFRDLLASNIENRSSSIKLKNFLGSLQAHEMLRDISSGSLPLLSVGDQKATAGRNATKDSPPSGLKEVVVPFFDYAEYADGSTILSRLSGAQRPAVGVYQLGQRSIRVRPLPTASEDRSLPPPTLIFHCDDLEAVDTTKEGTRTGKIGFSGSSRIGQLMVQHEDLLGLDIRFCSSEKVKSAFDEAQESLLAGSLDELQSANTLLAGGETSKDDDKIGVADCWVEVRANLKSPSGFLKRPNKSSASQKPSARPINTPDA